MGWTGGQYSLYRVALAIAVGCELVPSARVLATGVSAGANSVGTQGTLLAASASNPIALVLLGGALLVAGALMLGLAAGFRDRLAAQLLAPFVVFAELAARAQDAAGGSLGAILEALSGRTALLPALLLLLHARVPAAPFGSLEARDRTDPRGGWMRPAVQTEIAWGLLVVVLGARLFAVGQAFGGAFPTGGGIARAASGFELGLACVGLAMRATRPAVWSALALFGIGWLAAETAGAGAAEFSAGAASIHRGLSPALLLILACEPAWWGGRRLSPARAVVAEGMDDAETRVHSGRPLREAEALPARLFYDGDCGFCHRSVRFILAEELATPAALRLRFAPLGSDSFRASLARHPELDAASLPDSIVLELEDGVVLTRSAAALEIASRLGGIWRLLALAGRLVPKTLLDAGYDGIARVRKRLFAQPKDACPILPPDLRARFDS